MLAINTKKQGFISLDFIISLALSFVIVVGASLFCRLLDHRISNRPLIQPFGVFEKEIKTLFTSSLTIAEASPLRKDTNTEILWKGKVTTESPLTLTLRPSHVQQVRIGIKNFGTETWRPTDAMFLFTSARDESYLHHPSWRTGTTVQQLPKTISPGATVFFSFTVEAPRALGEYDEKFFLSRKGVAISPPISVHLKVTPDIKVVSSISKTQSEVVQATRLIQSASQLSLAPLGKIRFEVGYKNSGTSIWRQGGSAPLTVRSSAKRESYFHDISWESGNRIARIAADVKPGEVSYLAFTLHAPVTQGVYTEVLSLYAGEKKIPGTEISLPIAVRAASQTVLASAPIEPVLSQPVPPSPVPQNSSTVANQALYTITTPRQGVVDDIKEQEQKIRVGLYATREPVTLTANKDYEVRDGSGAILALVPAGGVTTVTYDFQTKLTTLVTPSSSSTISSYVRFQAPTTQGIDPLLAGAVTSPAANGIIFELQSYINRPTWNQTLNDNRYRTAMEIRYAPKTDKLWVINELPLEQYLKGISETSNGSPYEYQKALLIAARTFAKYHIEHSTKYLGENFTVRPTDADQVYRGYSAELRLPNVARAVDETRGVMVFYNNTLAITPYYSQSDGRTRSWEEVWAGGPKGWLVGKDDPACKGLQMLGHGIGMSARGALVMAGEGKNYEDILKYYYTNIELHKRY